MSEGRGWKRGAALVAAVLVIHLILIQPNHPGAMTWGALRMLPLELPLIVLVLVLAPAAARRGVRAVVTAALTVMPLVKIADFAAFVAYNRAFNPVLDAHLLHAVWMLTSGAIGTVPTLGVVAAIVAGTALLARLVWWATGRIARLEPPRPGRIGLAAVALPLAVLVPAADAVGGWRPLDPPGAAFTARLAREHALKLAETRGDLARFRDEAARDAFAGVPAERLLADLAGTDVLLIFVESYGRSTLENPRYAPTIAGRLTAIEAELEAAGLAMRSAYAEAPMIGGQSWLAHASVLSGLWIDNQRRYQALLASPRRTLFHYAAKAGWRTVAAMPAITLAWPEASYFGYQAIYAAADFGYQGLPFNWVTMPDQFALKALERFELGREDRDPVFAMVALISSHAPWTPIPPLLDWDELGDGRVFDEWAQSGDPPEVVWRDRDRVRDQFRLAVDYSLAVVGSFAARHAAAAPLMIVIGDHEPATFVSEMPESRDAPVHVIGTPEAITRLDAWGWSDGMLPGPEAPSWPMDRLRDRFLGAYTPGAERLQTRLWPDGDAQPVP